MTRAVFFTYPEKAFGSMHYELCKYLFGAGVDAVLLPWQVAYSLEEIAELDRVTDVFVTNPDGYHHFIDSYGIDPAKIVIIAHAILDLHQLIAAKGTQEFDRPRGFGVMSEFLKKEARNLGIQRVPEVLPMGINTSRYTQAAPATHLATVGFAGVFHRIDPHTQYDLKRGALVERCAQAAGLDFKVAERYHNSFVTMAGFYGSVDCIIIASTEEGACLPMLEAGAAGRLVISTSVGHWSERVGEKGGHEVPIAEDEFVAETTRLLEYYKNNPSEFQKKCREIQQHAKSYDWSFCLEPWVKIMST